MLGPQKGVDPTEWVEVTVNRLEVAALVDKVVGMAVVERTVMSLEVSVVPATMALTAVMLEEVDDVAGIFIVNVNN